jgi:hypothetical protein
MYTFLVIAVLSSVAMAQQFSTAVSVPKEDSVEHFSVGTTNASIPLPDLPGLPQGNSTVIGGAIHRVDWVRDQLTIDVFGGRQTKVLFDERTLVYRDGVQASLGSLRNGERVSLETVLDGTAVFARTIHTLSHSMEGECHGQVLDFNPGKGELIVRDVLSPKLVKLQITNVTTITREGQETSATAALGPGALVSIKFQPDRNGIVARQIAILATAGTAFVFSGRVTFLDLHSGLLVVTDPRDSKRYEIDFNPVRLPASQNLHEGTDVTVTAGFDGTRYTANAITIDSGGGR